MEAYLNSFPLVALPADDDGMEALTLGHFLVGRPVEALLDPSSLYHSLHLLMRWYLCQALMRHFWQRWSGEYMHSIQRYFKCHIQSRNLGIGDIVILREDSMIPGFYVLRLCFGRRIIFVLVYLFCVRRSHSFAHNFCPLCFMHACFV